MESPAQTCFTLQLPEDLKGPFLITRQNGSCGPAPRKSGWNVQENLMFLVFFVHFHSQLQRQCKTPKDRWAIFRLASKFIRTKSMTQCHNYYTRIRQQFHDLKIFRDFCKQLQKDFNSKLEHYEQQLNKFVCEITHFQDGQEAETEKLENDENNLQNGLGVGTI